LAGTLRITKGREWKRTLLDPYTQDWQDLALEITNQLNSLYKRSPLGDSFDKVEVEAFSPGSIIVDYYVVFNELQEPVNTQDLKDVVEAETRMSNSQDHMLGDLQIDPTKIDFIVVGVEAPEVASASDDEYMLLPPWAVAVVVIGLASVAFVIIFGVSMLAKRRKISRGMKGGKQAISLTEEMVYEMNRSGSTGYSGLDAAYHNYGLQGGDMESWKSDKYSQQGRYKRGSSSSSGGGTERQGRGHDRGEGPYQSGLYDSWKTEWNPTYRDYQTTHYPHPTSSYMTKGGRRPSYEDDF